MKRAHALSPAVAAGRSLGFGPGQPHRDPARQDLDLAVRQLPLGRHLGLVLVADGLDQQAARGVAGDRGRAAVSALQDAWLAKSVGGRPWAFSRCRGTASIFSTRSGRTFFSKNSASAGDGSDASAQASAGPASRKRRNAGKTPSLDRGRRINLLRRGRRRNPLRGR